MSQMNPDTARFNMVEQQIRPWNVLDQRILDLLNSSPRREYLPEEYRHLAYVDMNVPLGYGQFVIAPKLEARFLQALQIKPTDIILEVGTGSGHFTSLLAALAKHVYSVELVPELKMMAEKNLSAHKIQNVTLEIGDAANGWDLHKPYDVIVITGSLLSLSSNFQESLAVGGRLLATVGDSPVMEVILNRKIGPNNWILSSLFETDLPALNNIHHPEKFIF